MEVNVWVGREVLKGGWMGVGVTLGVCGLLHEVDRWLMLPIILRDILML